MSTQPENIYTRRTRELRKAWLSGEFDHAEARHLLDRETLKGASDRLEAERRQLTDLGASFSPPLNQNPPNLRRVYDQLNGKQR